MGGRGGNSGLSGGNSLPKLEGSEKQVAWAKNIRDNSRADNLPKMVDYVLNYEKYKEAEKKARESGKSVEYMNKFIKETGHAVVAREVMEHFVNAAYGKKWRTSSSMKKYFLDKSSEKYKPGNSAQDKKYRKWLVDEYKKVLKTQKSAKWWIDNRY